MSKHNEESLALSQVWKWKTAVWADLKKNSFVDAASIVADRAHEVTRGCGFHTVASPAKALRVAESSSPYGSKP